MRELEEYVKVSELLQHQIALLRAKIFLDGHHNMEGHLASKIMKMPEVSSDIYFVLFYIDLETYEVRHDPPKIGDPIVLKFHKKGKQWPSRRWLGLVVEAPRNHEFKVAVVVKRPSDSEAY